MNNKFSTLALVVSLCALALAFFHLAPIQTPTQKETTYDRVMRTRTLRCAYFTWRPFIMKDPNTAVVSGFIPDIVNEIGKELNIKIDYVEEVTIAQMFEGFATNRYDAVCGPITGNINRTPVADFTKPVGYASIDAYVRTEDTRFDKGTEAIDRPDVKIIAIEGEVGASVVPLKFPHAQLVTLPQISDNTQLLMELASGKADVVMADTASALTFMASNPGKIRKVEGVSPILLSGTIAIPPDAFRFKAMLDNSIDYLLGTGYIEALARKYGLQGLFYIAAIPHAEI